ncbi:HPP family protein [Actinomadura rugatobispora]|uniref:HPP family protein n=1 Tax=Actinomadura rugatobispora TaxID=1994 RepID=A0ABW1A2L6_9ACTN|nr:hypothetical protein GCM10010200_106800 [Actinomadura rugatobispora]
MRSAHVPLEERTAAEVMTMDLLTISARESVLMAWELMCRAEVHHLPVVDDEGGFLGIVDAATLTAAWDAAGPRRARRPVTTLLGEHAKDSVRPAATVPEAARSMLESGNDHVAVTDAQGALVGLITARDLITELAGAARDRTAQRSGMPSLYRIEPVLPGEAPAAARRDGRHSAGAGGFHRARPDEPLARRRPANAGEKEVTRPVIRDLRP